MVMVGHNISGILPTDLYTLTAADKERFAEEQQRGLLPPTDRRLSEPAGPVEPKAITSRPMQRVIHKMYDIAEGQRRHDIDNRKRRTLVGLAAPQVGEPYTIVLVDTLVDEQRKHFGRLECFVNPEIVWRSTQTVEGREGCFSAGPVWGLVRRPVALKIRAHTPEGKTVERIFENFTARIISHEIDHLHGIRFPERIASDKKRHWVHTEELSAYPEHITHWPRLCSRKRWQQLIGG